MPCHDCKYVEKLMCEPPCLDCEDDSNWHAVSKNTEDSLRKFVESLTSDELNHLKEIVNDYSGREGLGRGKYI